MSLTCVPCLGGSFARDLCFQRFADPIMSILDLGKVIFQPVDDLVDHHRPYAVFQYGADRTASAICSVTSVKQSSNVMRNGGSL